MDQPPPAGAPATPPAPPPMSSKPVQKNALMAALAYIGPLVIVSYLVAKDDPFVRFHVRQGLVLFVIEVAVWVLGSFLWSLWMVWEIVNFATLILSIVGIISAVQGKEKELPLVGSFGSSFPI